MRDLAQTALMIHGRPGRHIDMPPGLPFLPVSLDEIGEYAACGHHAKMTGTTCASNVLHINVTGADLTIWWCWFLEEGPGADLRRGVGPHTGLIPDLDYLDATELAAGHRLHYTVETFREELPQAGLNILSLVGVS